MYRIEFHPEAATEFNETVMWYEKQRPGLGTLVLAAMDRGLNSLAADPERWNFFVGNVRRHLLQRFPLAILYEVTEPQIRVLAVMHLRRRPGYWRHRQ
ncbi:MAG: type II toxin-antitoxin system RelE/ParE family toxin [Magnetococcales bacterium]|nr:type II toxin-antitoxin system RelE/ParE family toxin [Magnetococcales bacterium]